MNRPRANTIPATAEQFAAFADGIDALGGRNAAARALDMNERSVARLRDGTLPLYHHHCEALADALRAYAVRAEEVADRLAARVMIAPMARDVGFSLLPGAVNYVTGEDLRSLIERTS